MYFRAAGFPAPWSGTDVAVAIFTAENSAVVESYWIWGGSVGGVRVRGRGGQSPRPVVHSSFQMKSPAFYHMGRKHMR